MGRKIGSKNKNTNTAKNKNIININVNTSKTKKGRGRPRKQNSDTTQFRQSGGGGMMAPPQVIISQPTPQQDNSLLNSFITSKFLSESMNQNRTNMSNIEQPTNREQPSYFNARESIIPKLPDTPLKQELVPPPPVGKGPPPPPPPPKKLDLNGLTGRDAMIAELKYAQTDEGKAEKARKRAEAAAKKEAKQFEEETSPPKSTGQPNFYKKLKDTANTVADAASSELGTSIIESAINEIDKTHIASTLIGSALRGHRGRQKHKLEKDKADQNIEKRQSTTDFLNMTFTPPKKDIVQMLTPEKERQSTALTPYKGQQSTLDFLIGGTPQKTPQQLKVEKQIARLKEIKKSPKIKDIFEYNDLKTEITNQPNPNKSIASSIIGEAIKRKAAVPILENMKEQARKEQKLREDAALKLHATMKTKLTKQHREAKKELRSQHVGKPLVVAKNTKELILKVNRDRGIKAQQTAASKKNSKEQEKIINFAKFMLEQK